MQRGRLTAEIPELGERWRWLVPLGLVPFALGFGLTVTVGAVFHEAIMVGPGFVDEGISPLALAEQTLRTIGEQPGGATFVWVFVPLLAFAVVQNAWVCFRSYSLYPRITGKPYSLRELVTFFGLNAVLVGWLYAMIAVWAFAWWIAGDGFADGWQVLRSITVAAQGLLDRIPTLINVPWPLPLVVTILAVDLVAYWLHRICHTRRLPWLLLHRPHHMTPHLMMPATLPVYAAAPLFLLLALPFQVLMGAATKLFAPEPMIVEALVLRVVCHTLGIYSHCEVYYAWTRSCRPVRWLSAFYGAGCYHYLHHSARPEHMRVNLGNWFFMAWDRVFGTYAEPPDEKPPTGLTGQPALHMNPVRLAFAGVAQLIHEWKHNPGKRWRIVTGTVDYVPPVSRDYALRDSSPGEVARERLAGGVAVGVGGGA